MGSNLKIYDNDLAFLKKNIINVIKYEMILWDAYALDRKIRKNRLKILIENTEKEGFKIEVFHIYSTFYRLYYNNNPHFINRNRMGALKAGVRKLKLNELNK